MFIKNEECIIEIKTDETYRLNSSDNNLYDVVFNPGEYGDKDLHKILSISVNLYKKKYCIGIAGSYYIQDSQCAVYENGILTVLLDDAIVQMQISDAYIIKYIKLDCFGTNFGIYRVKNGYILHGEIEITMLGSDFTKKWKFTDSDIFSSASGKKSFELHEKFISLYDFDDNYYEIDYNGKLIREILRC
mgnify:FL=1